jgi:hypothetical protein
MKLSRFAASASLLVASSGGSAQGAISCPAPDAPASVLPELDAGGTVHLVPTSGVGELCTLSLREIRDDGSLGSPVPVARSYDGRPWEGTAGIFSGLDPTHVGQLSESAFPPVFAQDGAVTVPDPASHKRYGGFRYALRAYSRAAPFDFDRVEAARFLERATFGVKRDDVDALTAGGNDFAGWIEAQMDEAIMTPHQVWWRRRTNPRSEYSFYMAGPGPRTACDVKSRWRTFAFSDRDALYTGKGQPTKFFSILQDNGRYVWYVGGVPRTVTDEPPQLMVKGVAQPWKLGKLYHLHEGGNDNFNCVGCPLKVVYYENDRSETVGYIDNPKVDLDGMPPTPYTIVDLPPMNSAAFPSIDNGEQFEGTFLEQYNHPDDEFILNSTTAVDPTDCDNHPLTANAGEGTPSSTAKNPNNGKIAVESIFPPIYGRTTNQDGQTVYVIFDPHMELMENTPENPLPDGGGQRRVDSKGSLPEVTQWRDQNYVECSNVFRNFMNEHGCRVSNHTNACSRYADSRIKKSGPGVVVCGQRGEVANDLALKGDGRWDIYSNFRKHIYRQWVYADIKYSAWVNVVLESPDQLRQRVAWALYQIMPIGRPLPAFRTELWTSYYDTFTTNAFGSYFQILKELAFTDVMSE